MAAMTSCEIVLHLYTDDFFCVQRTLTSYVFEGIISVSLPRGPVDDQFNKRRQRLK